MPSLNDLLAAARYQHEKLMRLDAIITRNRARLCANVMLIKDDAFMAFCSRCHALSRRIAARGMALHDQIDAHLSAERTTPPCLA